MQTLIPQSASALAQPIGRTGRWLKYGLTPLAMLLLAAGLLLAAPAFWHPHWIRAMFAWDALILVLTIVDATLLPRPSAFHVVRTFLDSPQLGQQTRVEWRVRMNNESVAEVWLTDELTPALTTSPEEVHLRVLPRDESIATATIYPSERGDFAMGRIYLRYRGVLRLAERWAGAQPILSNGNPAHVRVFPALEESRDRTSFYLLRARQIEMQKRRLRLRGTGRDFESLREYQEGDELRNVSWTATARRGKLVSRQFTVERSQQVWIVLDAGRLSRTAFSLQRDTDVLAAETEQERTAAYQLTVTQLDQATQAAAMLAQVVNGSGDKFAMMSYGRQVQQVLAPAAGPGHLRVLVDLLSRTRADRAEADHLGAIARLKNLQRRRGLIVWITELTDSAGRPEIVTAAAELVRRHLVVLVLLKHPELEELAASKPTTRAGMFHTAAAQEMLERRRETLAQLERQGVLIVETTAQEIGINAISKYLEIKAQGML